MEDIPNDDSYSSSRRAALAAIGAGFTTAVAGCSGQQASREGYDRTQSGFDPPSLDYDEIYPNGEDISMFRRGLRRLGHYPGAAVPERVRKEWARPVNYIGHTAAKSSPRPTPHGNSILVASDTGRVHAMDPDGQHRWTHQTDATHLGIHGTPTIIDGVAYVGGYDGDLYALNIGDGSQVWRVPNKDIGGPTAIGSSPAYWDGDLYFMAEYLDPKVGSLWVVDAESGDPLWEDNQDIGGMPHPSPAIDPTEERLVAGSNDGVVYAWEFPSLEFAWEFETGGEVKGTPPIYEGSVYVGSWDGNLYSLDVEDGSEEWAYETGGIVMSNPAVDPDNGVIYVGSGDHFVYALDTESGEELWTRDVRGTVLGSLIVTDETVLVGSYDRYLYAFEKATGQLRWRIENRGHVTSEAVPHDGKLYYAERADIVNYWDDSQQTRLERPGHAYCLGPR